MRPPLCQPLHSLGRHHCEPFCYETRKKRDRVPTLVHRPQYQTQPNNQSGAISESSHLFSNLLQPPLPFQKSLDLPLPLPCIHIRTLCQEYTAQNMFSVCGQNTSPGGRQEQDLLWVLQIFGTTKASFINFFLFFNRTHGALIFQPIPGLCPQHWRSFVSQPFRPGSHWRFIEPKPGGSSSPSCRSPIPFQSTPGGFVSCTCDFSRNIAKKN